MIETVRDNLEIDPILKTDLIEISFSSPNSVVAAHIANLTAKIYIESQLDARLQLTQTATSWLTGRLVGLRDKLRRLPLPCVSEEFIARHVRPFFTLLEQFVFNHLLRGDTRVVHTRQPQRVVTTHALPADEMIHHGVAKNMPNVQDIAPIETLGAEVVPEVADW